MGTSHPPNDVRRPGDGLDRLVDEAVESVLGGEPIDLRAKVMARLDQHDEQPPRARFLAFRPAFLPVAGALLMVAGVGLLWQHADRQLARSATVRALVPNSAPRPAARGGPPAATRAARQPSPETLLPPAGRAASPPTGAASARQPKARVWLESDDDRKTVGAASELAEAEEEPASFPGAPAAELGHAIAPLPRPSPIVIPPLAPPPIVQAAPVSTLARPASTLADEVPPDRQDPGRPGGNRP